MLTDLRPDLPFFLKILRLFYFGFFSLSHLGGSGGPSADYVCPGGCGPRRREWEAVNVRRSVSDDPLCVVRVDLINKKIKRGAHLVIE